MLRIEKLTKRFGDNLAVDAATLDVDQPCMIGIIGRSGAGKSTLLRMINRLTEASDGQILFSGRDVTRLKGRDKRAWQADCAMIFQQFNLVPRMDVVSNVLHGTLYRHSTLATMFNLFPMDEIHRAIDILDRLGIAEHAPKRAEALSGGQQQRVAIARA
ncbi:MAG: ATP-binding cassette domain-containing protein, partial [Pseudomonadota bacterium]